MEEPVETHAQTASNTCLNRRLQSCPRSLQAFLTNHAPATSKVRRTGLPQCAPAAMFVMVLCQLFARRCWLDWADVVKRLTQSGSHSLQHSWLVCTTRSRSGYESNVTAFKNSINSPPAPTPFLDEAGPRTVRFDIGKAPFPLIVKSDRSARL